ncbi:MAPEG family protein [Vibrio sp. Of7-15]|uniref:MAPEG family protein n=1 Tax=Vibrio sp. Of7-15 TaxID=2724879 RepID=UPI001EF16C5D|nr:MAPEG family protein [Vibrio sp. Of7-15]MCG7497956.1 MAPEG family protein [Vibrio sp. Of7-15]
MFISLYAAVLGLLYIGLSVKVIKARRRYLVAIGDNDQQVLQRAIRVHGNFSEYVPFALVLLFFCEYSGLASGWGHVLGSILVIGRLLHAYGVSSVNENLKFRISGMAMTFSVIIACSCYLLWQSLI